MTGPFPCCEHCHAAPGEMGSHVNRCYEKGCAGAIAAPVTTRRLLGFLLGLAVVLYGAATVVLPVIAP